MAQAPKTRHVPVVNLRAVQRWRQLIAVELRIVSRPGNRAHVNDAFHAVCSEQTDEGID